MYTVSKGPSKIVAKTRRGISQNLERLETLRDATRKTGEPPAASSATAAAEEEDVEMIRNVPKPVFNVNGKSKLCSQRHRIQETITPQHEELIKFVYESWSQVDLRTANDSQPQEAVAVVVAAAAAAAAAATAAAAAATTVDPSEPNYKRAATATATATATAASSALYYNDGEPNGVLRDFKPFDLESWWGKRLYNNITKSL